MANQHAAPPQNQSGPALPQLPEPTHAERARTLFSLGSTATLCTQSRKHPGFPFGSLMPYALDPAGRPLLLISNMAMHTQNLRADPRCSLFLSQAAHRLAGEADGDPLGAARATLVGEAVLVPEENKPEARERYLARHENSRYWVDFSDFHFFRIEPLELYYVGGFGNMGWVESPAYTTAAADPLASAAAAILTHMNADHTDAMLLLAHTHATQPEHKLATAAAMTSVDRLGFTLRLTTPEGLKGLRLNFPHEVHDPQATREALVAMVRHARSA